MVSKAIEFYFSDAILSPYGVRGFSRFLSVSKGWFSRTEYQLKFPFNDDSGTVFLHHDLGFSKQAEKIKRDTFFSLGYGLRYQSKSMSLESSWSRGHHYSKDTITSDWMWFWTVRWTV